MSDHTGSSCKFCAAAQGLSAQPEDQPLATTKNFIAIPSIGSLVPGWTLIVPRSHKLNFAEFYSDQEATSMRRHLAAALEREFKAPIRMFEHGATSTGSGTGCGVDHAHLHLVPLSTTLQELAHKARDYSWKRVSADQIPDEALETEYLLLSDDASLKSPSYSFARLESPRSQYFRRLIANAMGEPDTYNYREHPRPANARETRVRLAHDELTHALESRSAA